MTEQQPGDVLDEAVQLLDVLRRRFAGGSGGPSAAGDAWGRATARVPHIATGAPECTNCPLCRAAALVRAAGPGVRRRVRDAGGSLLAAALAAAAAFDPARDGVPGPGAESARGERGGPWAAATREAAERG
ncbi:hypothetical protein [Actinomadura atramentaria]|uniref:hypothetical protein n=1 Tax=Actinomadura atramentaria TaxID=1990 RepID=UPI000377031D|nr:hypothetical protein [Actinomadura atramentaria]